MFRTFIPPAAPALIIDPSEIKKTAAWMEKTPRGFSLPGSSVWEAMDRDRLYRQIEEDLAKPLTKLTDELYLDFMVSGKREPFTVPYNRWIDRASQLALAVCLDDKGRFLPELKATLHEILSEKSWVYPMHDGPIGYPSFHGERNYVDLGAAVRAGELAAISYWMGDRLDEELRNRLRAEIERRVVQPYLGYVYQGHQAPGWWWVLTKTNWNAVCHAGVTYAALTVVEDIDTRAMVAASAAKHISLYFEGFTPDGYISEGLGYWNYGFGHFTVLAETLLRATGNRLDLYREHAAKVGAVASYPIRTEMTPSVYPAFSDCPFDAKPAAWILQVLSKRVAIPSSAQGQTGVYQTSYQRDLSLAPAPIVIGERIPIPSNSPLRDYFLEAGILISRPVPTTRGLVLAAKGGHNAEMHNHNDVGSFVVACNGESVMGDPGLEIYNKLTFSDHRYDSSINNSYGHPVPVIDGKLQSVGRQAQGPITQAEFTDARDTLTVEMAAAYDVAGLESVKRSFSLDRSGATSLMIIDEIIAAQPVDVSTALITFSEVRQISPTSLEIRSATSGIKVEIHAGDEPITIREEFLKEQLPENRRAKRIGIYLSRKTTHARITTSVVPI